MITFSIITCTYNAAQVLQRTLESVSDQDYAHIEHIILDGLSTDATMALAKAYKAQDDETNNGHQVIVVSEEDHGLYDAMNKGIRKATGDYLVFLNAGDKLPSPQTLQQVADQMGDDEELPAVLYGEADIVDNEGHFIRHRRLQAPEALSWESFKQGMVVCHQSFYVRTDMAQKCPYDKRYKYSADVDWCIRIMKSAEIRNLPLRNTGMVLVNYLAGGMSIKNHRASLMERFRIMTDHYGLMTTIGQHLWFVVRAITKK